MREVKGVKEVVKGEVYWANLPVLENSHIQSGVRPVIIWCNKMAGKYSPVVQYIPVTSKTGKMKRKMLPTHTLLEKKCPYMDSVALAEQLGCIDKNRLGSKICDITPEDKHKIKLTIEIQQGNEEEENTYYVINNKYCFA